MSFVPYDRPVRAAFIGLGRIYDLNMRAYPASKASLNMRKVQWAQGVPPLADHRRRSWIHRH